ncbi:protein NO VEIN domain-containing protein [Glutamicibacter ardleyensis]|uniref:protein NO VEIN domain-containing protein n=1 Tax=Glutamicibacter ardleyensis TaxID=225894 RepID=UPI003FD14488
MNEITTSDFPQADRIGTVRTIVRAVHAGLTEEAELERAIGLDSKGRQARYYRRAAVTLGLLEMSDSIPVLTELGIGLALSRSEESDDILRIAVANSIVFGKILEYISLVRPDHPKLKSYVRQLYPGASGTADRRVSTIVSYLQDTKLVQNRNGQFEKTSFYESLLEAKLVGSTSAGQTGKPKLQKNNDPYRKRTVGFIRDAKLRKAIEIQAVTQATKYYEDLGYDVEDVGATHSFDLRATKPGHERHIEVKGSQKPIDKCILTINEVEHARKYGNTDLALVGNISVSQTTDEVGWTTVPGELRLIKDWVPLEQDLRPLSFSYDVVFNKGVMSQDIGDSSDGFSGDTSTHN